MPPSRCRRSNDGRSADTLKFAPCGFYNNSAELRRVLAERESNSRVPWAVAPGAFLCSDDLHKRLTDEVIAMTVRELRTALASLEANSEVQVVLFKNDGTCDVFELEEVLSNNGHAQLEIYEAEPVREENPEG